MDLLMDRTVGHFDLVFVNGECPTTGDEVDRVIQRLYIRLKTLLSEWYLDVDYGIPYLQRILGHKTLKSTVDMILQGEILDETGVQQVLEFSSSLNNLTRQYECSFKVVVQSGATSQTITI